MAKKWLHDPDLVSEARVVRIILLMLVIMPRDPNLFLPFLGNMITEKTPQLAMS